MNTKIGLTLLESFLQLKLVMNSSFPQVITMKVVVVNIHSPCSGHKHIQMCT